MVCFFNKTKMGFCKLINNKFIKILQLRIFMLIINFNSLSIILCLYNNYNNYNNYINNNNYNLLIINYSILILYLCLIYLCQIFSTIYFINFINCKLIYLDLVVNLKKIYYNLILF